MNVAEKLVFVGLSGGVDSAVTAALLKDRGARVVGVFIKGWYPPGMPCTWSEDRKDAMRVAARLSIPFVTLDASLEYKRGVIDYLLSEYRAGRTPNPDVMCNREVKFGAFYRFAKEKGADYIATGHYARSEGGRLLRGVDQGKDQSYFLWAVPKEALAMTLFPLGGLKKVDTRSLAKKYGLPNATKKDSQGICFLGSISVEDFLMSEFGSEPGEALDVHGAPVGTHNGVLLHTLGSKVALTHAAPGPWYAVRKDVAKNHLVVSKERMAATSTDALALTETNWLNEPGDEEVSAQFRYHGPVIEGVISKDGTTFTPTTPLNEPLAPGQSLVLYRNDELLGGGILS